eukprot:COSAG01_NODE_3957_length_5496_cov_3.491199_1_plen_159_part_00
MSIRQWEKHADAAYIGCWSQALQTTTRRIGDAEICMMPELVTMLKEAAVFQQAKMGAGLRDICVSSMAVDLHTAWERGEINHEQFLQEMEALGFVPGEISEYTAAAHPRSYFDPTTTEGQAHIEQDQLNQLKIAITSFTSANAKAFDAFLREFYDASN